MTEVEVNEVIELQDAIEDIQLQMKDIDISIPASTLQWLMVGDNMERVTIYIRLYNRMVFMRRRLMELKYDTTGDS